MKVKAEAKQKYDNRTAYTNADWGQMRVAMKQNVFDTFIRSCVVSAAEKGDTQVILSNMFKNCLMMHNSSLPAPMADGKINKILNEKLADFNAELQAWLENEGLIVAVSNGTLIVSGWA